MNLSDVLGGAGGGYKNKEIKTVSGTFTVPANVFRLKIGAQGGGASGWSTSGSTSVTGGSGGNAGNFVAVELDVMPGDILSYTIGAGGIGTTGNNGQGGGATSVRFGTKPICVAYGGSANSTTVPSTTQYGVFGPAISSNVECVEGGVAGGPGTPGAFASSSLRCIGRYNDFAGPGIIAVGIDVGVGASGGTGGSAQGGGGGGTSIYGKGGNGGAQASNGNNAPAGNYGAGGGGAGGSTTNVVGQYKGGNGENGCVEIWY